MLQYHWLPLTIKFDKKQKRCIQLVADDGLHGRKAFYKVKNQFYLQFTNDAEFTDFKLFHGRIGPFNTEKPDHWLAEQFNGLVSTL